jgi:hypothetical protein
MILIPRSVENVRSPPLSVPPPSPLTCTPTKSNLYLASSLETVIREPTLYKFLTFHNPNLMSIFRRLGRLSKESVQVRGSFWKFVKKLLFKVKGLDPHAQPPIWSRPSSFVRDCLFNIFAANLHSWRPFLHPQPEDAPCCGDRDPT